MTRHRKSLELALLYILPPALIWAGVAPMRTVMMVVFLAAGTFYYLEHRKGPDNAKHPSPAAPIRAQAWFVIARFGASAVVLTAFVLLLMPERLFAFPRAEPRIWLMVMLLYPLVSAALQELTYRALFYRRYAEQFSSRASRTTANIALFAWLHVFFPTPPSIALSIVLGAFLTHTYERTRSFRLVWLEHSLYGNFVFTIGLGHWFYYPAT